MIEKLTYVLITYALFNRLRNLLCHSLVTALFPFDDAKVWAFHSADKKSSRILLKQPVLLMRVNVCVRTHREMQPFCVRTQFLTEDRKNGFESIGGGQEH